MRRLWAIFVVAAFSGCITGVDPCPEFQLPAEILELQAQNPSGAASVAGVVRPKSLVHPYLGVPATLRTVEGNYSRHDPVSTGDGYFAFLQVEPGVELILEIEIRGYKPQQTRPFVLKPGQHAKFCFELSPEPEIGITENRPRTPNQNPSTAASAMVDAPFVEDLSADSAIARQQRLRLVSAIEDGRSYGLRRTQYSVEGTPVHLLLTTTDGELSFVTDYRDDDYSSRQIYTKHPTSVELGRVRPEELHPLRAWFPSQDEEYLRCVFPDGKVEFF